MMSDLLRWKETRFSERFPSRFSLAELHREKIRTATHRYPLVEWESGWTIRANNRFPVFMYPKDAPVGQKFSDLVIMLNGFDERPIELFYYYNRPTSLATLLSKAPRDSTSQVGSPSVACILVPIPFHHWRRPVKDRYLHLNSSQMIYDDEIRLYLGFEQLLCDVSQIVSSMKSDSSWMRKFVSENTRIHLMGYSLGGLAALSSFLMDKLTSSNRIESCQLLASGVSLDRIDFQSVQLEETENITIQDMDKRVRSFYLEGADHWSKNLNRVKRDEPKDSELIQELFDRVVLGRESGSHSSVRKSIESQWVQMSNRILYVFLESDLVMPRAKAFLSSPEGAITQCEEIPGIGHYLIRHKEWWKTGAPAAVKLMHRNMFSSS